MVYIFTAMYCEARVFIECCGLKKVQQSTRFQQFVNPEENVVLTITGVGEIAAAAAVGSVCTQKKPEAWDFMLHTGICGGTSRAQGLYLLHKLTEQASGRTFYPDILYRHPFQEAEMITGMAPWHGSRDYVQSTGGFQEPEDTGIIPLVCLYDMEAAAVYQAGAYFFGPHQMVFLKLVSDHGDTGSVSGRQTEQLMYEYKDAFLDFLAQLLAVSADGAPQENRDAPRLAEQAGWMEKVCRDMCCTKAMGDLLKQHMHYLELTGVDYKAVVSRMYEEHILPCQNKAEGKRCFAEFKKQLF